MYRRVRNQMVQGAIEVPMHESTQEFYTCTLKKLTAKAVDFCQLDHC